MSSAEYVRMGSPTASLWPQPKQVFVDFSKEVRSFFSFYLKHHKADSLLFSGSVVIVVISGAFLSQNMQALAEKCFDAEVLSQQDFNICDQDFIFPLIFYHGLLAASSFVIGFLFQSHQKISPTEELEEFPRRISRALQWTKDKLQQEYRFETLLLLLYLYNGIGINVSDVSSFLSFLQCMAAGISLGAFVLGIYTYQSYISQEHALPLINVATHIHENKVSSITALVAIAIFAVSFVNATFPDKVRKIIREISFLVGARFISKLSSHALEKHRESPFVSAFLKVANAQSVFIAFAYIIYITADSTPFYLLSMSILGWAQGIHASRFSLENTDSQLSSTQEPTEKFQKILSVIRRIITPLVLISFVIALEITRFMDCIGPATVYNYSCPIGLELSGYIYPNQVVVESDGFTVFLIFAMAQYYLQEAFSYLARKYDNPTVVTNYLNWTKKYLFTVLSLVPYALLQENVQTDGSFYSYNPFISLSLLGLALGAYKQHVHQQKKGKSTQIELS